MKSAEIRELSVDERKDRLAELEEELFRLRLQNTTGQLDSPLRIRQLRRDIARCKTIQREQAREEKA
ncbi:MAG: 50S ribosomal protein L29 [Gemmatimonadota bacterium]|jgi:large subunit ribosomal protein L29